MERGILKHAFILAGGRSCRFGSDKTALRRNGRLVLADVVTMLKELQYEVTILGPSTGHLSTLLCRVIPDEISFNGALPAIIRAFDVVGCDRALVMAADMPLLQPDVIRMMACHGDPYDLVVLEGGTFPAIYSCRVVVEMQEMVKFDDRRFQALHARLADTTHTIPESQWRIVDPDGLSLRNINTPEDWYQTP